VEIGDRNTFREGVTVNRGTAEDAGLTRIGDDNWLMAYVHVAHDCEVGNRTIMANYTGLAGHVAVGDWAILGGATTVHQFVRIGAHSFTSMGAYLAQDLPPYVMAAGNMAKPFGINSEGLRRRGFTAEAIARVKRAYRTLYRAGLGLEESKRELAAQAEGAPEVRALLEFVEQSKRGIIR
jgi:UDP-N-acetylglucosamine acyltransferase